MSSGPRLVPAVSWEAMGRNSTATVPATPTTMMKTKEVGRKSPRFARGSRVVRGRGEGHAETASLGTGTPETVRIAATLLTPSPLSAAYCCCCMAIQVLVHLL